MRKLRKNFLNFNGADMRFPPQHGAWAFLIVPSLITAFLGGGTWMGYLFFLTWVVAYPFTYFLGRALISRVRRGSWTDRGSRELRYAAPWTVLTIIGAITLIATRPWILLPGILVVALWSITVYLSWAGRERGITNDLLLIALASLAPIMMFQVATDHSSLKDLPDAIWMTSLVSLLFFIESVVHVKALIREANNPRWHMGSIAIHLVVLVGMAVFAGSWWLLIPFALALGRTVFMKPGLRPGGIGAIESVVALALVICTVIAETN